MAQSVNFEAVRVRPQIRGGERGLELEFRATVEGLKGKTCEFNVVFFDNQGQTLKDKDQKYFSASGDVSAAVTFTSAHDNTLIDTLENPAFRIFLPLGQLHLAPGTHPLRARMALVNTESNAVVGLSNMATLVVSQP